jgi:hypothetical protein
MSNLLPELRNETPMRNMHSRLLKLEHRLRCGDHAQPGIRVIVSQAGLEPALGENRCIEILEECGYLRANSGGISLVLLADIPRNLSAEETERFLREHGYRVCGGPGSANFQWRLG